MRLDQGRDTVSEGQAYGMLLAEVAGDYGAFQRIWLWTHRHLQHRDGLFSFHTNARGKVTSRQPASDADLLIAWALLRYSGPKAAVWHRAGRRVAHAILAYELASGPGGMLVLTAGPWATGSPAGSTLDPSYWSLPAMESLGSQLLVAACDGKPRAADRQQCVASPGGQCRYPDGPTQQERQAPATRLGKTGLGGSGPA